MSMKELVRAIIKETESKLSPMGFKKRAGEIFTVEPVAGFLGWIGLNRAMRESNVVEINPVIGVRCERIEMLVAELEGEKPHPYNPPTVSVSLGYLMPDSCYRPWLFEDLPKVSDGVAGMIGAVAEYGLPFINSALSVDAIANLLLSGKYGIPHQNAYRLPVAFHLSGKNHEADERSTTYLRSLDRRTDLAAERYKKFHRNLKRLLETAEKGVG